MRSQDILYSLSNKGEYGKLIEYIQKHNDKHVRYGAAGVLLESVYEFKMKANKEDHKKLIDIVLTEPNDSIRAKVLEILIQIKDESVLETIITRLGSSSYPTPKKTPYPRILTKWHSSTYYTLRLLAVVGFGSITEKSYKTKLRTSIRKESHVKVLRRAIEEGGKIGDETFVTPIQNYIYNPSDEFQTTDESEVEDIKKTAIEALVEIESDAAYEALLAATRKKDKSLKEHAIKKIGEFGAERSLDIVVDKLDAKDSKIRKSAAESVLDTVSESDDSHSIRMKIIEELNKDSDVNVTDQFSEIVSDADENPKRRNSAWLIGQLEESSENNIEALLQAVVSEDPYLQKIAAASLYKLDKDSVIEHIEEYLTEVNTNSDEYELLKYIKSRLETDYKKEVVEYTYVTKPSDYG